METQKIIGIALLGLFCILSFMPFVAMAFPRYLIPGRPENKTRVRAFLYWLLWAFLPLLVMPAFVNPTPGGMLSSAVLAAMIFFGLWRMHRKLSAPAAFPSRQEENDTGAQNM